MVELIKSASFELWLTSLRDGNAVARINSRLARLAVGNPGDVKPVGEGVSEMRIDHGPGYRVYLTRRGELVVILLAGGDKSTQARDIKKAKQIAKEWRD